MESLSSVFDYSSFNPLFYFHSDTNEAAKGLSPLTGTLYTPTNFYVFDKYVKETGEKVVLSGEIHYIKQKGTEAKPGKRKKYKIFGDRFYLIADAKKSKIPIKYLSLKKGYAYLFTLKSQHYFYYFCNGIGLTIHFLDLNDARMKLVSDHIRNHCVLMPFKSFYDVTAIISQAEAMQVVLLKSLEESKLYCGKMLEKKKYMKLKDRLRIKEIINNHKIAKSEHVANLLEVFEDENHLILVTEYYEFSNLKIFMLQNWDDFTELTVKEILRNCLSMLDFLNTKSILHNEINLTNILISEPDLAVKIIDFQSSVLLNKAKLVSSVRSGNFYFKAPELYENSGELNTKSDLYSLGIVFLLLVSGYMPQNLFRNEYYFYIIEELKSKISPEGIDLIENMIEVDPVKRISIQDALNHTWFKKSNSLIKFGRQEDATFTSKLVTSPIENMKKYNSQVMKTANGFSLENIKPTFVRNKISQILSINQIEGDKSKIVEALKNDGSPDSLK